MTKKKKNHFKNCPKIPQNTKKMPQNDPKKPKNCPKCSKTAKIAKNDPKNAQNSDFFHPKSPQIPAKSWPRPPLLTSWMRSSSSSLISMLIGCRGKRSKTSTNRGRRRSQPDAERPGGNFNLINQNSVKFNYVQLNSMKLNWIKRN